MVLYLFVGGIASKNELWDILGVTYGRNSTAQYWAQVATECTLRYLDLEISNKSKEQTMARTPRTPSYPPRLLLLRVTDGIVADDIAIAADGVAAEGITEDGSAGGRRGGRSHIGQRGCQCRHGEGRVGHGRARRGGEAVPQRAFARGALARVTIARGGAHREGLQGGDPRRGRRCG